MLQLSDEQIAFIEEDLERRGIEMKELRLNLLDHICCIMEQEMKVGDDFKSFYHLTLKKFYKKELKEIEKETKLLIKHKYYYTMKKSINISGMISSLGFITGGILKYFHLPGAGLMLIIAFASFALFFLPLAIWIKSTDKPNFSNRFQLVLGLLVAVAAVLGTLFKIMHWPWANIMMNGSFLIFVFIFIPVYFFIGIREKDRRQSVIINTALCIGAAGILFSLVNLSGSRKYNHSIVQTDQLILENIDNLDKNLVDTVSNKSDKYNHEMSLALDSAAILTDQLINKIMMATGDSGKPATIEQISSDNSFDFCSQILFFEPGKDLNSNVYKLRLAYLNVDRFITVENQKIVKDNLPDGTGERTSWENSMLKNNTVAITVRKLNLLKLKLRILALKNHKTKI